MSKLLAILQRAAANIHDGHDHADGVKAGTGDVRFNQCQRSLCSDLRWAIDEVTSPAWTPFEKGTVPLAVRALGDSVILINSRYQVNIRFLGELPPFGFMAHLSIKRRDKSPLRNWRDLQRIKNEVCGEHCTAVEIFPPEAHLVDTSNQYHLWVFREYEFPFGFKDGRMVSDFTAGNSVQEPFEQRPTDLNAREVEVRELFAALKADGATDGSH